MNEFKEEDFMQASQIIYCPPSTTTSSSFTLKTSGKAEQGLYSKGQLLFISDLFYLSDFHVYLAVR